MTIKLVVAGALGRMGQAVIAQASNDPKFKVIYGLENELTGATAIVGTNQYDFQIGTDLQQIRHGDVVVDFSIPEASMDIANVSAILKKPIVIGTTGFSPVQERNLKRITKGIPVLKSANMSIGVNVLFKIARETARVLGGYDVTIQETHHKHKKDKPSGTALQVGKLMEELLENKISYDSRREGEVIGDHKIIFSSHWDTLELVHHAKTRSMFAAGALYGAMWIKGKKPGTYTMQDALGLK